MLGPAAVFPESRFAIPYPEIALVPKLPLRFYFLRPPIYLRSSAAAVEQREGNLLASLHSAASAPNYLLSTRLQAVVSEPIISLAPRMTYPANARALRHGLKALHRECVPQEPRHRDRAWIAA